MAELCKCCLAAVKPDAPEPQVHGLCPVCDSTWAVFAKMTAGYKDHLAAEVLCHSRRDIIRRMGCTSTAHNSAIGNAAIRTGVKREVLFRVTRWALKNDLLDRPKGFEDCNPNGYAPPTEQRPVTSIKTEPTPTGKARPQAKSNPAVWRPKAATPSQASPATPTAVEALSPTPVAPSVLTDANEPPANISAAEAMGNIRGLLDEWAPGVVDAAHDAADVDTYEPGTFALAHSQFMSAKRGLDDSWAALKRAQDAYKEAAEALIDCGRVVA